MNPEHPFFPLDRWLRRRQGVYEYSSHPQCLFRIERAMADQALSLADGTQVRPGDPLLKLHIWNEHVPCIGRDGATVGWACRARRVIDTSLRELAQYLATQAELDDVTLIQGDMQFGSADRNDQLVRILGRYGFVGLARCDADRPGWLRRLGESVFMLLLVTAINPPALRVAALRRDHKRIVISRAALERRYGIGRCYDGISAVGAVLNAAGGAGGIPEAAAGEIRREDCLSNPGAQ